MARKREHPKNPLSCGCGAKGTLDLTYDPPRYQGVHVTFCPLHEAAPDMYKALKWIAKLGGNLSDAVIESIGGINDGMSRALMYSEARRQARAAMEKAEGR